MYNNSDYINSDNRQQFRRINVTILTETLEQQYDLNGLPILKANILHTTPTGYCSTVDTEFLLDTILKAYKHTIRSWECVNILMHPFTCNIHERASLHYCDRHEPTARLQNLLNIIPTDRVFRLHLTHNVHCTAI